MRVHVQHEVTLHDPSREFQLFLQWGNYNYDDGTAQKGYRFIWKQNGKLKPTRGQARIPSTDDIIALVSAAKAAGWGNLDERKGLV